MAGINAAGLGSNLDVNGIVTQLMSLERAPVTQLDNREASYKAKISAYGTLKSTLAALQSAANAIATPSKLRAVTGSIGDATLASVTVGSNAAVGSHSLEVKELAQAHRLRSDVHATADTVVGTGTLTIQLGSYSGGTFTANAAAASATVTVGGSGSLSDVRDAINAANIGVTASLVTDSAGTRLAISSKETGATNAIRITATDNDGNHTDASGLSALAYDAATGGTMNLVETSVAKNAIAVVDGIEISSASNKLVNTLDGLTINLAKAAPGTTTTINVTRDSAGAKAAVEGFVKAWNDAAKTMQALTAFDATSRTASVLTGDATVAGVRQQLRDTLDVAGGGFASLFDIGIKTGTNGALTLDTAKLDAALANPDKDIAALFSAVGTPSASGISLSASSKTAAAGSYAIDITQAASRGFAAGSQMAAGTITAGVNDTLQLMVDGVAATVTLSAGNYTASQLVAEIQSKVNGSTALRDAGVSVSVSSNAGVLTVMSSRYGAESSVQVTGGNGAADLFGAASSTQGTNVAGTIGGVAATGVGQVLSASGLSVLVSGSTLGARGTIDFTKGAASKLDQLIADLTATEGAIASRTDGLNRSVLDIGKRRDALNARLELTEKRLRAQFTALDTLVARMNSTSSFLAQQLANLPTISS